MSSCWWPVISAVAALQLYIELLRPTCKHYYIGTYMHTHDVFLMCSLFIHWACFDMFFLCFLCFGVACARYLALRLELASEPFPSVDNIICYMWTAERGLEHKRSPEAQGKIYVHYYPRWPRVRRANMRQVALLLCIHVRFVLRQRLPRSLFYR